MGRPIRNITIVGGGTAGWMTALLLQTGFKENRPGKPRHTITLIESPNVPTVGVGEATVPGMPRTLRQGGISERQFFKTCNASFKLGVDFVDWNRDAKGKPISYVNPFSGPPPLDRTDLGVYYSELGAKGLDYVQTFSPAVDFMHACKGPRPLGAKEFDPGFRFGFAYHLDAGRFAKLLQEVCTAKGVRHVREDVLDVELDDRGYVSALQLKDSGRHPVEFVIDCTGFRGLIVNKALGEPFVSYSEYLANDRAMAVQIPHPHPTKIEPVTRSTALGAGWSWRVPLYNRIGTGYVYSSAHRTDDEARDEFLAHLGEAGKGAEPRVIPMRVGRNRNAWVKNCVAIGLSGGFIEPLESTAIHMIDVGVRWLVSYFPDSDFAPPLRDQYNRLTDALYNEVRDFICLHYALGNRTDSPYWIDVRNEMKVPETLARNIELWQHVLPGPYDLQFDSLFTYETYQAVLLGKRVYETGYGEGKINRGIVLDTQKWSAYLKKLRANVDNAMRAAPDHRRLLDDLRGETPRAEQVPFPAQMPASGFPLAQATVPLPGAMPPKAKIARKESRILQEQDDVSLL